MESYKTHFLYPAALFVSNEPYYINTILGSCVAVCLYDNIYKVGGMAHFMLPLWNANGLASPKYGNIAIDRLIEKLESHGSKKYNLKAKIFGGGEVIVTKSTYFNIGKRNIEVAQKILGEYNIPIISSSTGGKQGRKIVFNTFTGEVRHRYVKRQHLDKQ